MDFECWERNENGKLIPQEGEIVFDRNEILTEINILEMREDIDKKVISKAVEILKDTYEKTKKTQKILFTPLLQCEISSITRGDNFGCDGKYTEDQRADVCARHCEDPYMTFNQWRDLKDGTLKQKISSYIMQNSFRKAKQLSEEDKLIEESFRKARNLIQDQSKSVC